MTRSAATSDRRGHLPMAFGFWAALAVSLLPSASARADWNDAGAINLGLTVDVDGRLGGAFLADLWHPIGVFRIGFAAGAGNFTSGEEADNRIFAPAGLSMALFFGEERVRAHLGLRAGVWGGADFEGLTGGVFGTAGARLDVHLGGGLSLGLGGDVWLFAGGPTRLAFAPTLTLSWGPEES